MSRIHKKHGFVRSAANGDAREATGATGIDGIHGDTRGTGGGTSRLARLAALLAALTLLGSLFLAFYLDRSLPPVGGPATQASRGMVVLFEDEHAPRLANRLLAAGLSVHGIGLAILPEPKAGSTGSAGAERMAEAIDRLRRETGLTADRFIYAGQSGAIPALVDLMARRTQTGLPRPGGLLLLLPDAADGTHPENLAALPEDMPAAIIADAATRSSGHAADLFLWLTGEDASLFPGFQGGQPLAAKVWLSVDGRRRLVLLPALSLLNSGWSPRLHQAIVQTAAVALVSGPAAGASGTSPGPSAQPGTAVGSDPTDRMPESTGVIYNRTLLALIALLLWAASPLLLIVAKSGWTVGPAWLSGGSGPVAQQAEPVRRLPAFVEIPLYLPAAALAFPAGRLLADLSGDPRLVTGLRFYALLGIYGWFYFLITWGRRHVPEGDQPVPDADRKSLCGVRRKWLPTVVSALAAGALLLTAAYWLQATAGRPLPRTEILPALRTLVPLWLLMLPALLPFAHGFRHPIQGMPRITALLHGMIPALFLFGLRLVERPGDIAGALLAAASGMILLLAARAVARSLSATVVRAFVPALAGLLVLLLFRPFPLF